MTTQPTSDRPHNPTSNRPMRHRGPHMDFTPMVDLGFLLITFFMLTTSLSRPQMMPLVMPDDSGISEPLKESKALTVLLGGENKVYWYEGQDYDQWDSTTFESKGLRAIILQKMGKVQDQFGLQTYQDAKTGEVRQGSHLNVIIKPGNHSCYKNLVDALDEMAICRVRYYCVMDPTNEEAQQLNR